MEEEGMGKGMKTANLGDRYLGLLGRWVTSAPGSLYIPDDGSGTGCFGIGDHGHWSMQTNNNAMASLAVLSHAEGLDEKAAGHSREQLLDCALKLLRFTLRSHKAGPGTAYDGEKWGCNWISALCIERMMHGIHALGDHLSEEDREMFRNMLVAESDWLIDGYEVAAAIDARSGKNRPESNIWNGTILHRTAMMFPDCPRKDEYVERGNSFLLNGISVPGDAMGSRQIAGRALGEWHVGPNFTENYAL
ncbi:MAG: hypothetical protein JW808_11585, partial [Victivallales bacterium]|nr:hypothetical protein [Victivallales bacterium]